MTSLTSPAPAAPRPAPVDEPIEQGNSLWHDAWLRLRKNKLATFGLASLAVISLACLLGLIVSIRVHPCPSVVKKILPPSSVSPWCHPLRD